MARITKAQLEKRGENVAPHDIGKRSHQTWVSVTDLKVDRRYQRAVTKSRVERMVMHFDPDAFGTVTLSRRENGEVFLLDGQHRVEAMKAMGWQDQQVPALVYEGLSLEEEARIFRLMNAEATSPKAIDIFRARLTEGEPVAVGMDKIVRSVGLVLSNQPGKGHIQAIAGVERIYVQGGEQVLLYTLRVMKDAFAHLDDGTQTPYVSDLLQGVAVILARYGRQVDQQRLAKVLGRSNPQALLRDARATAQAISATNIALNVIPIMLVQRYNSRIDATKRLPQWEIKVNKHVWKPLIVKVVAG